MQMNNKKKYLVPIMSISIFLMLIFGAGYAYFTATFSMNTSNYQISLPKQTSLICTKTDCNVTITPAMMAEGNYSTTNPKATSTCYLDCVCSGTPNAICTYDVSLVETGDAYTPSSTLGTNKEFSVKITSPSGCSAQNSSSTETQVNTIRNKVVSSCSLTVPAGGSVSANISAEFKWYNVPLDQTSHQSKVYQYQITNSSGGSSGSGGNQGGTQVDPVSPDEPEEPEEPPCFTSDTPITLANGTTKAAIDITYDDELLVWDFDNGTFTTAKPLWIDKEYPYMGYFRTVWSDGSVFDATGSYFAHRAYNIERRSFIYTTDFEIGEHTFNDDGEIIELVDKYTVYEEIIACNIITEYHMNIFAGHILTSARLSNLYEIDTNMKYVNDGRSVIPASQFDIPTKWYYGLRVGEQPLNINPNGSYNIGDDTVEDYVKRLIKSAKTFN